MCNAIPDIEFRARFNFTTGEVVPQRTRKKCSHGRASGHATYIGNQKCTETGCESVARMERLMPRETGHGDAAQVALLPRRVPCLETLRG